MDPCRGGGRSAQASALQAETVVGLRLSSKAVAVGPGELCRNLYACMGVYFRECVRSRLGYRTWRIRRGALSRSPWTLQARSQELVLQPRERGWWGASRMARSRQQAWMKCLGGRDCEQKAKAVDAGMLARQILDPLERR